MSRLTVTIPARNEAKLIERTLLALSAQQGVAPGDFDVIVFANNCVDDTVQRVRRFAREYPTLPITVLEAALSGEDAHIGWARNRVMNAAARRFHERGVDGIIASTDADTVVAPTWVANTIDEMRDVDAVAGRIHILDADFAILPHHQRAAYERDGVYYRMLALLEATHDPVEWDPAPRHADHFGGSFAVRASVYSLVGGVPMIRCLEDVALYNRLLRADRRVRHSHRVYVETSGRQHARVTGGFATHLADLDRLGEWRVEHPQITIGLMRARRILRRMWERKMSESEARTLANALDLAPARVVTVLDFSLTYGENWHRLFEASQPIRETHTRVPIEDALAVLASAIDAVAEPATRMSAASGAG